MPVVLVVGILVILAGVFYVAIGRGGELAYEQADHAPLDLGPVSATDVALLRPPTALWGYNMQVTDEALDRIARALRDRDVLIASLQRQLGDASRDQPLVTAIEAESLMGATGLTQPARWDEVIVAREEAAAALDDAATALDEAAVALNQNAADMNAADTTVIGTDAPATDEIPTTDAAETSALRTVDIAEQPRRFVPKHERPRKASRKAAPSAGLASAEAEKAEAEMDRAEPPAVADAPATMDTPAVAGKPDEDAEEQGW